MDPPRVETRGIEPKSMTDHGLRPPESLGAAGPRRRGVARASYFYGEVLTGFASVCTRVCTRHLAAHGIKTGGVIGTLANTIWIH